MCGIAGYSVLDASQSGALIHAMSASIRHRGPDDEGFAFFNRATQAGEAYASTRSPRVVKCELQELRPTHQVSAHHTALAHVRYSIIGPGAGGHQPMWSSCSNVCLTFNGEVYNYVELREELAARGMVFRGDSDTEVLLAGYLAWGEEVFERVNGFFAVALYDRRKRATLLARDRLGKAHLYLKRDRNGTVFWASEIKALIAAGVVSNDCIDTRAVADFIFFNRRDQRGTLWADVEDFPPGHLAWVAPQRVFRPQAYWMLPHGRLRRADLSQREAAHGLRERLVEALRIRLRADVPIGFELSGGMDSSALVGLAAADLDARFSAYTIDFDTPGASETGYARQVAARYPNHIEHRVLRPTKMSFWEDADRFVWEQEEPFHAPNLHANQQLRRTLKAEGAHVVISGSAGDELLAGYASDYLAPFLRHLLARGEMSRFLQELYRNTELSAWRAVKRLLADLLLSEGARILYAKKRSGEGALLAKVVSEDVASASKGIVSPASDKSFSTRVRANMTYRKMNYWLRSGAKANYGIPIEARAPFLDFRVVEYCMQLPPEYLIVDGWHKHLLRMAVDDILPRDVVWRRNKMGFPFPWTEWLVASRRVVERNLKGIDCPYVRGHKLMEAYENLASRAPTTLWRLISVSLWWRRVVERREILAS